MNAPATSCAMSFGLSLLHSHLKLNKTKGIEMMCDPFVKILTQCVKYSNDTNAILISLKCLQILLRLDLPSTPKYRIELVECILKILSSMSCNTQNEMVQGSFKTLTLLLAIDRKRAIEYLENTNMDNENHTKVEMTKVQDEVHKPILNDGQMQVLVSILQSALTDPEHHNSTFGVIKAITSRKYISPDYYDLMDTILKMTVQSQKSTMRQVRSFCATNGISSRLFLKLIIFCALTNSMLRRFLCNI
jgi:U3 small nucleolar RNA-associated protein 20